MNTKTTYHVGAKPNKKTTTMYLTMQEKREIIKEISVTALVLLEFYLSVVTRKSYIITDTKTAEATGLSLRTVQDTRRLLVKHNLFHEIKTTNSDTIIYLYCARKEGVYSQKYFDRLFGCNSVPEVYRKNTRKMVDTILANASLSPMEIKDINCLLDDYHSKKSTKKNYQW